MRVSGSTRFVEDTERQAPIRFQSRAWMRLASVWKSVTPWIS
jgi:hypothetical protein